MKYDVVLIGSGISSLTAAALLAKKGKSVLVLEKHSKPGGYLHCFKRFGHRFDTGAHYVGAMKPGQAFHSLLKYLNVYREETFVPMATDGFDVLRYPSFEIKMPQGYEAVIANLSEEFPSQAKGIASFFHELHSVAANFPTYGLKVEPDLALAASALEVSLEQVVKRFISDSRLISVLYCYCALHGVHPKDVPFGMHAIMMDSFISGSMGLKNGGDHLAQAYVEEILRNGGKLCLNTQVVNIEVAKPVSGPPLATTVITDKGERIQSEWVISGIHPKATFAMVQSPEIFSKAFLSRLAQVEETGAIFGVYALFKKNPGFDWNRNYFFLSSNDPEKVLDYGAPDRKPHTIFLCPANRTSNNGGQFTLNIHAAGPIQWFNDWRDSKFGARPTAYSNLKFQYVERIFEMMEAFQPGISDALEKSASSTPLSNLHFNGSEEGSSYGIYHSISNTGLRGFGPRTHIANLLLTGQSTLFPGLMGSAVSGLRTVGHILGIKNIVAEIREVAGL